MATIGKWGPKEQGGAAGYAAGWASDQAVYEWRGSYTFDTAPDDEKLKAELFGTEMRVGSGINFRNYSHMKISIREGPPNLKPLANFEEADLHRTIKENIRLMGYTEPTPVQASKSAIPILLRNYDLMACAQTGSGKTAAFLIPIISSILKKIEQKKLAPVRMGNHRGAGQYKASPMALVILPTRELAIQIFDDARRFTYKTPLRPVAFYGGANPAAQRNQSVQGCDILIGTPGRIKDMIQRGVVTLSRVRYLVLDEADRMLDMGFEGDIRQIVLQADMPRDESLQTLMFSATFPRPIQVLARAFLKSDFTQLRIGRIGGTTSDIVQRIRYVEDYAKRDELVKLLLDSPPNRTMIFTETKRSADNLDDFLYNRHFPTVSIHGDRTQQERELSLKAFKDGRSPILIATAVASRGLDIKDVMHVINYDLCNDIDEYVHRIGRTARVGNLGMATSFFNSKNSIIAPQLAKILQECNQEIPDFLAGYVDESTTYETDDFVAEHELAEYGGEGMELSTESGNGGGEWGGHPATDNSGWGGSHSGENADSGWSSNNASNNVAASGW
ncbi:hypothetical protein BGZ94_006100 [Podila epigama]|nr:hypothetical protein BGZ94_006100 [Podila epigama]